MKKITLLLIFLAGFSRVMGQTSTLNKAQWVKVYITSTESYCGGARPSDEILQDVQTPKPYAFKTFYIRKGAQNSKGKAIKVVTDSAGCFSIKLKPGKYCLLYPTQLKEPDYSKYKSTQVRSTQGKACLKAWWLKGWQVISVKDTADRGHKQIIQYPFPLLY
jgi:hypothetical protein